MLMPVVTLALAGLVPLAADAAPYGATYAPTPALLPTLTVGQTTTVSVTVTNTGTLTWTPTSANPFRLSYHWYATGAVAAGTVPRTPAPNYGAVVFSGLRTNLPGPVGATASVTLSAQIQAPSKPGTYVLKWDLVHENVTWFSWQGVPTKDQTVTVRSIAVAGEPFKALRATCKIVECDEVKITKIVPFVSMIVPGGPVVIEGRGFGTQPGEVRLIGSVPQGTLGSFQGGYLRLEDLQWGSTVIFGKIPQVTSVLDQPAKLLVLTKDGGVSNSTDVQFRATREMIQLPQEDVKVVQCGFDSNQDRCNGLTDPSDSGTFINFSGTLDAEHENCWGCVGDDYGFDAYQIRLKNQWVFDSMYLEKLVSEEGEGSIYGLDQTGPFGLPEGKDYWAPDIEWRVTPNDWVRYSAYINIVGPTGIPYK